MLKEICQACEYQGWHGKEEADKLNLKHTCNKKIAKITHCQKLIHEDAICGVKLDCHLHDWRQREQIVQAVKKENQEWINGKRCVRCGTAKKYDALCDTCDNCLDNN